MKLGKSIKMARINAAKTQQEIAVDTGVSTAYISMLENDKRDPSWSYLCSLCEALGISVAMLVLMAHSTNDEGDPSSREVSSALVSTLLGMTKKS